MYIYIYYFLKFYPFIYYAFTLYRIVEYYSFAKKVYILLATAFCKAFNQVKESEEIDEIYEMISMTEPDKTVTIDDTKYVTYHAGETVEIKPDWYAVEV